MASEFTPLSENDTKEMRKELGFPTTKELRYLRRENGTWQERRVADYRILYTYQSGACSLLVRLDDGKELRIHSDYLADMQKPAFTSGAEEPETGEKAAAGTAAAGEKPKGKCIEAVPDTYIIVDLETTGTNHFKDQIIEIGAVKYVRGSETERYCTLVKTERPLPEKIVELTGITDGMLKSGGIDRAEAVRALYEFLGDGIVIGHNFASFDSSFLEDAFMDVLKCHFSNDYVDTLFMARKRLPDLEHHRLEDLAEEFDIDYSRAHRAGDDCIINHLVYEYMAFGKILDQDTANGFLMTQASEERPEPTEETEMFAAMDETDLTGWKEQAAIALADLVKEEHLPDGSLCLMPNKSTKNGEVTSYSVCIYEPDLVEESRVVERNSIVMRITEGKLKSNPDILTIEPRNPNEFEAIRLPEDASRYEPEKASAYIRIDRSSKNLIPYLTASVKLALENYIPKASPFACCARYERCSDAGDCIHPNRLFAKACQYRKNLKAGNVFYGCEKAGGPV